MSQLITLFPFVLDTVQKLEQLNKGLRKVTLTGKISALDVASTLFEFTDDTIYRFDELRAELSQALLEANLDKLLGELKIKSQIAIDVLIRNLFERTADVGFLATDDIIISFLTTDEIAADTMRKRLKEYVNKYSVYNEIIILDPDGKVKANLNESNTIIASNDPLIAKALQSDSYIEVHRKSDLFPKQSRTLIYAQKITQHGKAVGVLCLCFKFVDELTLILNNLTQKNLLIAIADSSGVIVSNSLRQNQTLQFKNTAYQITSDKQLGVTLKTAGYQGYKGIDEWYATAIAAQNTVQHTLVAAVSIPESSQQRQRNLLSDKFNAIIKKADNLVDDLGDVIINGELIASKKRVYVLTPILDNLRQISNALLETIKSSVVNLEQLVESALINDVKMASNLAIDIMDRNLYERANDCRWWALTPKFQQELASEEPNSKSLHETLLYINNLYTVYTNLYLYNTEGKVVAASKDQSIVQRDITDTCLSNINTNKNTQNYFVSNFERTPFYENRPTYIYNATIHSNKKNVGGIGIVFDSEVEFIAMLEDSFPVTKEGFSVFVDKDMKIIATTHKKLKPLDTLQIDQTLLISTKQESTHHYLEFEDQDYIVGIAKSKGYREYKCQDNYKNEIFALTFIAL